MSPAPLSNADREGGDRYRDAWRAIMQLAREGQSWSGNERNCAFLNCPDLGSTQFANVSAVTGLDHDGDGRALAATDWDGDGDLDLWFRDRTAPRLRLMVNHSAGTGPASPGNCLIRLQGTRANRDAIGARVTLTFTDKSAAARTLRAGDAYLSQSSKWLHFGCGNKQIAGIEVAWPGGGTESFTGVTSGARHLLVQGTGEAKVMAARDQQQIVYNKPSGASPQLALTPDPSAAQILLPAKVPLPDLVFQAAPQATPAQLETSSSPRLFVFWSSGCPNCAGLISRFANEGAPGGLQLVNADTAADPSSPDPFTSATDKLAALGATGLPNTFAIPGTLERIAHFQRALFDNHIPFAVPLSVLTDGDRNAVAIYRGDIPSGVLTAHTGLVGADNKTLRTAAAPFHGRWFTNPITPAEMAEMIGKLFLEQFPSDAASMFGRAVVLADKATEKSKFVSITFNLHHKIARESAARQPEKSRYHFHEAIELNPQHAEIRCDFGALLANHQQFAEAEAQFRKALELRPDYPLAQKNLDLLIRIQNQ